MKKNKPIIGITSEDIFPPNGGQLTYSVPLGYLEIVKEAGANGIILPFDLDLLDFYLDLVDGIISVGGRDIDPKFYNQAPYSDSMRLLTQERTAFELALVKEAVARNKPYLGVCCGLQCLTVALGGTLIQDIDNHGGRELGHRAKDGQPMATHDITIQENSHLFRLCGSREIVVNSFHHQCIDKPGENMVITAWDKNGYPEAADILNRDFITGVQWHPERSPKDPATKALLRGLVDIAGKRK